MGKTRSYMVSRALEHGVRRAEEMREGGTNGARGRDRTVDGLGHRRARTVGGLVSTMLMFYETIWRDASWR